MACFFRVKGAARSRKIKCDGRIKYVDVAAPNVPRRWPNTILDYVAPVIKIIFITSIGLVY